MLVEYHSGDDTQFLEVCRENGWKRTAQRRAVFDCLCGNRMHPSVETVWRLVRTKLPDISLDSVYRILDDFADAGLVRRLGGLRAVRYDADTGPHHHFVCTECGALIDFKFTPVSRVADLCSGFGTVSAVELNVRGVCDECRGKRR